MTSESLKARTRKSLADMARRRGVGRWHSMTKSELVRALLRIASAKAKSPRTMLRARTNGHGRTAAHRKHGSAAAQRNGRVREQMVVLKSKDISTQNGARPSHKVVRNTLKAEICDRQWLRAQWDLSHESIRRAQLRLRAEWHGAVPALRVIDVSGEEIHCVSEAVIKDVEIQAGSNTWYVRLPGNQKLIRLQVGYRTAKGAFFSLAKSNVINVPVMTDNLTSRNGQAHAESNSESTRGIPELREREIMSENQQKE